MKKKKLKLIEGLFSESDAREILINLFTRKINFHQLKNFSSEERFGKKDEHALQRIQELKECIHEIEQIFDEAKNNNKQLKIVSEVHITLKK